MRTDVVIGAASGMGAAIAGRLAGEGRRLLLADLDVAGAERVAVGLGPGVEVLGFDLRSPDGVDGVARLVEQLGVLVLTAGLSPTMAGTDILVDGGAVAAFTSGRADGRASSPDP